jgi:hypothetical protein
LTAGLQATFPSPKNGLFSVLGYEPLIFDLDYTRAWSRKKSRLITPKNRTSKNQGDVEAFILGYWGGDALIKVDLEKILSLTYLGGIFLKFHIEFLMYDIIALLTPARICEAISSLEEKASSQT